MPVGRCETGLQQHKFTFNIGLDSADELQEVENYVHPVIRYSCVCHGKVYQETQIYHESLMGRSNINLLLIWTLVMLTSHRKLRSAHFVIGYS